MVSTKRIENTVLMILPLLAPLYFAQRSTSHVKQYLLIITTISVVAFIITHLLIPIMKRYTIKKMHGKDINKKGTPAGDVPIPESLGIAAGIVYLACGVSGEYWYSHDPAKLVEYNAALLSICFIILLGFVDDALDIPWRYKLILPTIAAFPILIAYSGATTVMIPHIASSILPRVLELGILYKIFMLLIMVFCSNAINIHAGINGLECGQSYIIGIAILTHNIIEATQDEDGRYQHIFSIFLTTPFIATTMALLLHNWYPSDVFVGDTYTMFSGMTLAVAGILGHFSKTLLLFFIPQILNFLYSLPQLFEICGYKCPRHRLPKYNVETKLLEGIPSNFNLVNLFLIIFGPMSERSLCIILLVFQFLCCALGLYVRYGLAKFMY